MIFMDLMNRVFRDYLDSFVIVFIDDIFIYSKNEDEHDSQLTLALRFLKEQQFSAKFSKCEFCLQLVAFLARIISCDGVEVDLKKTDAVKICLDLGVLQT